MAIMERSPTGRCEQSILPLPKGRVRLQCAWPDDPQKVEMIEEYRLHEKPYRRGNGRRVSELVTRKWRVKDSIKNYGPYFYEVGEPTVASSGQGEAKQVRESASNPVWKSREAAEFWEWRVENIDYPVETYAVSVDEGKQQLVLRTSNRKFYKRWKIEELRRRGQALDLACASYEHDGASTLTIRYGKSDEQLTADLERELGVLELLRNGGRTDGDGDGGKQECTQS